MTFLEAFKKKHPDYSDEYAIKFCACIEMEAPKPVGCFSECGGDESLICGACWNREMPETDTPKKDIVYQKATSEELEDFWYGVKCPEQPEGNTIKIISAYREEEPASPRVLDSGARREFGTGAVRDSNENKGRCDLLPLDVVAAYVEDDNESVDWVLMHISKFQEYGQEHYLFNALNTFSQKRSWDPYTMLLEASKQYADGAAKYGANNWKMGMPVQVCIDSAVRHYLKWLRGDEDEPHDRAVCWNLLCAIWTSKHKPELNEYEKTTETDAAKRCEASIKVQAALQALLNDDVQDAIRYLGEVLE